MRNDLKALSTAGPGSSELRSAEADGEDHRGAGCRELAVRAPVAAAGALSARSCIPCRPVEVPRKRSVVPAPDVAQDGGLKFRHDVQGDDLPARRLEGPAHRLGAAEKLQESRHF